MSRPSWIFRLALIVGAGALLVTATVIAVAPRMWTIANAHEEEPIELPEFAPLAQRTYVYDALGNEIAFYELENSQPVALADVPQVVIDAFLAVEDAAFFTHQGVNVRSLFRAVVSNFSTDAPQQGASTITMQVVKNDFLAGLERDGRYKLLQIVYALRLEKQYSKEEILQRYLNTVFFGNNSYGIAAAAETYFGKPVQQLTLVEAAFLAGLVRSPSGYDPINNPERSRARFLQVLDRLVADGLMTELEAEAVADEFVIPERARSIPERAVERTYFTEALRDYLLNRSNILGETYDERYGKLYRGGLRIHTTLNQYLQEQAENARDVLPDNSDGIDAAIVSLDTTNGAIRAMVGGRGFEPGRNEVNLALAPSQTGSSIKIFILAAALQAGAQGADLIDGADPCSFDVPGNVEEPVFRIDAAGPRNPVDTVDYMTAASINCAYARLSQIVGLNRVVDTVYRMASSVYLRRDTPATEREPIQPFISFATGANEMSALDMAAGMQTIANEGSHHEPYYVEYIDDAAGTRLYTHIPVATQVLDRDVALRAIEVLKGPLRSGTASRELSDFARLRPAAGKTGTQELNTVATFVGSTPFLTTAVLVRDPRRYTPMRVEDGNPDGVPEFLAEGVDRVQGGTYPARIWGAYMEPAHVFAPVTDWAAPGAPSRGPARLYLPGAECVFRVVGYQPAAPAPTGGNEGDDGSENPDAGQPPAGEEPQGFVRPRQEQPPPDTTPPATSVPESTAPPTTAAPVPIYERITSDTTVPPDVLDPRAPMPSAPLNAMVRAC